jgi:hypothetical protein
MEMHKKEKLHYTTKSGLKSQVSLPSSNELPFKNQGSGKNQLHHCLPKVCALSGRLK